MTKPSTFKEIFELQNKKIVKQEKIKSKIIKKKAVKKVYKSPGKDFILKVLTDLNIEFELEYKFLSDRKFRFDYSIKSLKISCEYEGLGIGKSRHTSKLGYSKDCQKYNLAVINDWRVLRYTALNYKDFENDIKKILNLVIK